MNPHSIHIAYAFFHQKERIYRYSTLDWQRDDIEVAIADYVAQMDAELRQWLENGRTDFLRDHVRFGDDIQEAVTRLEELL